MAVSDYCKINFQGPNGGYLTIDKDGALHLHVVITDEPDGDILTFEKKRVDWTENNEEIVIFRSKSNERKYLSGHEHGHTVNGEPKSIDDKLQPGSNSHWVLQNFADLLESDTDGKYDRVALYHPPTRCYFVIKPHAEDPNSTDFRLSNKDDVFEYGAFVLERID